MNDVAKALAREAQKLAGGAVEGVYAFPHPYGCSQLEEDQDNTRKVLADLATHPNAGGVLILGLGCENSGIDQIPRKTADNTLTPGCLVLEGGGSLSGRNCSSV